MTGTTGVAEWTVDWTLSSIRGGKFHDWHCRYTFLKENSAPCKNECHISKGIPNTKPNHEETVLLLLHFQSCDPYYICNFHYVTNNFISIGIYTWSSIYNFGFLEWAELNIEDYPTLSYNCNYCIQGEDCNWNIFVFQLYILFSLNTKFFPRLSKLLSGTPLLFSFL
jgi:hypothetical protein